MAQSAHFQPIEIGPGIRAFIQPTDQFRRVHVAAFIHLPLAKETVAGAALLPQILRRGTRNHPTGLDLENALADLYGASLNAGVHKIGDRQVQAFSVSLPADAHVPESVFPAGLQLLREVVFEPAEHEGGFVPDYVEQEKLLQVGRIRSLINQKIQYAVTRCVGEAFSDEPYGLYSLGTEEAVIALERDALWALHQKLLAESPIDIYVTGAINPDEVRSKLEETFTLDRPVPEPLTATQVATRPGDAREIVQEEPMEQAWLVLCLRSDISYGDEARWAMMMFNGLLGGTTQSKLFMNVRERASLAYAAASQYDSNKGVILALAGIAPASFEQASQLIQEQIDALRRGEISDDEWEGTLRSLVNRLRLTQDSPGGQILRHLQGAIEGVDQTVDDAIAGLESLTPQQVADVGQRLQLDTIFLLRGKAKQLASAGD